MSNNKLHWLEHEREDALRRMDMPRRGDVIQDEYGTLTCMCVCDGYVMCRRPRAMPTVMPVKEWLNRGKRHIRSAERAYAKKHAHIVGVERPLF